MNFRTLGTMIDCSRNGVMNIPSLKKWIDILSDLGYNNLMLYTEDTYEVENQPYFGYLRGRYSAEELRTIDDYAYSKGIEVIPAIQTLAHLYTIFRWEDYKNINDCSDIILADCDKTYELIDDMLASLSKNLRTKTVNIGMDEAHMLGRGKYFDLHGSVDRFDILIKHLNRVADIAKKYGMKCIMWGDMFFRLLGNNYYATDSSKATVPERIKNLIPDNVDLIYWDYYSTDKNRYLGQIEYHSALKDGIWFAGGLWSWSGFAPHNGYSIDATNAAFSACLDKGVKDVFLTMWGDNGGECSKFTLLPSLYYASEAAKGNYEAESIKKGFFDKFGIEFDAFMELDLLGTPNSVKNNTYNTEKYMLYNDCLMGIFDSTVADGDADKYAAAAERLKKYEDNPEYGYIFKTMRTICDVLAIKINIGLRTRAAYDKGDKEALKAITADYEALLKLVKEFYNAFRAQWFKDNKPQGFEIHDARLGGLYFRIKHCLDRINSYVNGEIDRVEELDERLLDAYCRPEFDKKPIYHNSWGSNISANII